MNTIVAASTWITVANVLYLASYAVHDILWLRVLTVTATLFLIPYYDLQPTPLWTPIIWNCVFLAINGYWIVRLVLERRPVSLTADERRLRELSFPSLTAREALSLFKAGTWQDREVGSSIVQHDKRRALFSVIVSGIAHVEHGGTKVAELGEGQFVGEIMSRADTEPDIDVVVVHPVRLMCWPRAHLQAFIATRPDVALALTRSVGLQLRRLLDATVFAPPGGPA